MVTKRELVKMCKGSDKILHKNGELPNLDIQQFWEWGFADILMNITRGVFAEFLVTKALIPDEVLQPRNAWDNYDVLYSECKIEVKSSAYLQSWEQDTEKAKNVQIKFSVESKYIYDEKTKQRKKNKERVADCYVFCLFQPTLADEENADVLDTSQWQFFIVPTQVIDNIESIRKKPIQMQLPTLPNAKSKKPQTTRSIKLSELEDLMNQPQYQACCRSRVPYSGLRENIDEVIKWIKAKADSFSS